MTAPLIKRNVIGVDDCETLSLALQLVYVSIRSVCTGKYTQFQCHIAFHKGQGKHMYLIELNKCAWNILLKYRTL
jgi:hypothetical protein